MANETSILQSLRAVDTWIDVINANINGGVRTGFKTSRLRFGGSNTQIDRPPTTTSLPLQFPEPSLVTTNTVIDFTQGAIVSSTELVHLAIQGKGFFVLNEQSGLANDYFTRDGEFHTDAQGYLSHSCGLYLFDAASNELVWDDSNGGAPPNAFDVLLSDFVDAGGGSLATFDDPQMLEYTIYGSTIFNYPNFAGNLGTLADATILQKSLEASNSSMTQAVPELSLAQKLFSALTKVLQIGQTNRDNVLNLIR